MSRAAGPQALANWPPRRPVALLVLARSAAPELAETLRAALEGTPGLRDWWWLDPENMVAGEGVAPAYRWAALLDCAGPDQGRRFLSLVNGHPEAAGVAVHLGRPLPAAARRLLGLVQALLKRLPIAIEEPPPDIDARWMGGVNPGPAQIERMRALPGDEPVGVLNMHCYRRSAADPFTGEMRPGRVLGKRYMRRGLLTFTRVGGHISWAATGLGQLHGPPETAWEEFALIWYPGRNAFNAMSGNRRFHQVIPYRKAGLEVAEVSMARISASSRPREVRS